MHNINPKTVTYLDSSNQFSIISAKFEDVSFLNTDSVHNIHLFIESKIKLDLIKPLSFIMFPYTDIETAFR